MTTTHPNAQPVVYAHRVEFTAPAGVVTPLSWRQAFRSLVASVDTELRRGDSETAGMALELIGFELLNPRVLAKEAEIEAKRAEKAPVPSTIMRPKEKRKTILGSAACAVCSDTFTLRRKTQIYCSPTCRTKAQPPRVVGNGRKSRQKVKPCPTCGVEVTKYRATYCEECIKERNREYERKRKAARREQEASA